MNFTTKITISKANLPIDYSSKIVLLGSCFAENIGKKLEYFKFQNLQNPLGILFQSKTIETLISNAVNKKEYTSDDVFYHNEQWHCFDAHSRLSNVSREELIKELNTSTKATAEYLQKATHVLITLGTAWIYRLIETNKFVANCHKVPQGQFSKELMSVEDITNSLEAILDFIKRVNSKATIIFTVSPVRHIKDGFVENTRSKAHLVTAVHSVLNKGVYYFPAYEIMMDELRDYRFYAEDMVHPNTLAIDYIWEKFKEVWFSDESHSIMEMVDAIQKGLQHKPFNPKAEAYKVFLQKLKEKQSQLQELYPHIVF